MKNLRSYKFDARSSSRTLLCSVLMPDVNSTFTAVHIAVELGDPVSSADCPSRIRVNARPDVPIQLVMDEVQHLFSTLKMMYDL